MGQVQDVLNEIKTVYQCSFSVRCHENQGHDLSMKSSTIHRLPLPSKFLTSYQNYSYDVVVVVIIIMALLLLMLLLLLLLMLWLLILTLVMLILLFETTVATAAAADLVFFCSSC